MEPGEAPLYSFSATRLDGRPTCLREFHGHVLLIVNTASKCGFTPQYGAIESLYLKYKERGFEVLGFPCNQFGNQEPGSAEEIGAFCTRIYGVTFPMFAKVDVNGPSAHPLFSFLKKSKPGLLGSQRIKWNFTKFLVDRGGNVVKRFAPSANPGALAPNIEALLVQTTPNRRVKDGA